VGQTLAVK
jgi:hypothetical protein